ncbi:hypothetical protein [Endozoicomonas sp. 8E]|uniref:hypothetical protein n=1 Tax=Endozoicomonas sp. 8E TaxID=3035692 RepID=UPI002938D78C|nr:hypothetical protein [Endozoicomonas sp. 8E]WOG27921.1 hypothetical protein P6910_25805 [Endozoicomonas sp. 8E]
MLSGISVSSGDRLEGMLIPGSYLNGHLLMFSGNMAITSKASHHSALGALTVSSENNLCRDDGGQYSDTLRLQWSDDATGSILNLYGYNLRLLSKNCYTGTLSQTLKPESSMQLIAFCIDKFDDKHTPSTMTGQLNSDEIKHKVCSEERLLKETALSKEDCLNHFDTQSQADKDVRFSDTKRQPVDHNPLQQPLYYFAK